MDFAEVLSSSGCFDVVVGIEMGKEAFNCLDGGRERGIADALVGAGDGDIDVHEVFERARFLENDGQPDSTGEFGEFIVGIIGRARGQEAGDGLAGFEVVLAGDWRVDIGGRERAEDFVSDGAAEGGEATIDPDAGLAGKRFQQNFQVKDFGVTWGELGDFGAGGFMNAVEKADGDVLEVHGFSFLIRACWVADGDLGGRGVARTTKTG